MIWKYIPHDVALIYITLHRLPVQLFQHNLALSDPM